MTYQDSTLPAAREHVDEHIICQHVQLLLVFTLQGSFAMMQIFASSWRCTMRDPWLL